MNNANLGNLVAEKVKRLPIEQIVKVNEFIDSLENRNLDIQLTSDSTKVAESVFNKVWDNSEDSEYDNL